MEQKGKDLQEVVAEIKGEYVTINQSKEFSSDNFAEIYAWIKHDVLINQSKIK